MAIAGESLLAAMDRGTLGAGSVAGGETLRNMKDARICSDGTVRWVEVCYCPAPFEEGRPYGEEFLELVKVPDAHDRRKCHDENGSGPWACGECHGAAGLDERLRNTRENLP